MEKETKWLSVKEYSKIKGLKSPQVVYNWIAKNKLKEKENWRKIEITKTKIEVKYE